ncbi:MAG: hypothetical protein QOG52_1503 [Frankiaceae bacterium]|nr:hypothetical protein [Frankiaceae bacterium]
MTFPSERKQQRDAAALARRLESLQLPAVPLRRHADLGLPMQERGGRWGRNPSAVGIGAREDAAALYRRADGSDGALVRHVAPDSTEERLLPTVGDLLTAVQPLSGGRTAVLVQDTRNADPQTCATALTLIGADGLELATAEAGPDTVALLATTDDRLWVGYGDIGHYAHHPLAWQGLAVFDPQLMAPRAWRVSDLALLNVSDDVVHASGYSDETVLRIAGGAAQPFAAGWQTYSTLLVDGDRAVLVGGTLGLSYDDVYVRGAALQAWDVAVPIAMQDGAMHPVGPAVRLVAPDGAELPRRRSWTARGPHLHVVAGREWWRLDLDNLPFH